MLLMAIIVVVDITENLQRFLDNNAPMSAVITGYYMNFIPYFINLFIPLFTFISVIWFTSKLCCSCRATSTIMCHLIGKLCYFGLAAHPCGK